MILVFPPRHAETDVLIRWSYEPYRLQNRLKIIADWFVGWMSVFFVVFWVLVSRLSKPSPAMTPAFIPPSPAGSVANVAA